MHHAVLWFLWCYFFYNFIVAWLWHVRHVDQWFLWCYYSMCIMQTGDSCCAPDTCIMQTSDLCGVTITHASLRQVYLVVWLWRSHCSQSGDWCWVTLAHASCTNQRRFLWCDSDIRIMRCVQAGDSCDLIMTNACVQTGECRWVTVTHALCADQPCDYITFIVFRLMIFVVWLWSCIARRPLIIVVWLWSMHCLQTGDYCDVTAMG